MDAVEYVKQRNRMCDYYVNCGDCPASNYEGCSSLNGIPKMVPIVEQWAKEHPVKTRQGELLKIFPNAKIDNAGTLCVAPCQLNVELLQCESQEDCEKRGVCSKCRCDFWLKEIK